METVAVLGGRSPPKSGAPVRFQGKQCSYVALPSQGAGDPCDSTNPLLRGPQGAQIAGLCARQGIDTRTFLNDHTQASGLTAGNTALREETGDSYTAGVVLRSPFEHPLLASASLTVDYFDIRIKDAIGVIAGPTALQACYNINGFNPTYDVNNFYCGLIQRDASKLISGILQPTQNLASYETAGLDVAASWSVDVADLGWGEDRGRIGLSTVVSFVDKYRVQNLPGSPFLELAGSIGSDPLAAANISHPKYRASTTLTYGVGGVTGGLRWTHIDDMINAACVGRTGCVTPGTRAVDYYDLFGRWAVNEKIEVRGSVTNLLDKGPPAFTGIGTVDFSTYDVVGRRFLLGVTARF